MNFYLILATLGWGIWGFCQKNASSRMSVSDVQLMAFIANTLIMPLYFVTSSSMNFSGVTLGGSVWAIGAQIATIVAGFAYLKSLETIDVSTVTLITSLYPKITFILAVVFLGEKLTLSKFAGIVIVMFGVWLFGRA